MLKLKFIKINCVFMEDLDMWNKYAESYDMFINLSSVYNELIECVAEHLSNSQKSLDIGCGTGNLLSKLNGEVFGIDDNIAMLVHSLKKSKASVANQDSNDLSFPDEYFDGISCINVLYYVKNPIGLINEANRVLKKEGIFVVAGPKPNMNYEILEERFNQDIKQGNVRLTQEIIDKMELFKKINKELIKNCLRNVYEAKEMEEILINRGFEKIIESRDDLYLGQSYLVAAQK